MQLTVTVCHDEREGIWYVESSDVPGLNAEAPTYDELVEVIADLAPDLVAANLPDPALVPRRRFPCGSAADLSLGRAA